MGKENLKDFLQSKTPQPSNTLPLSDFLKVKTQEAEANNNYLGEANKGLYENPIESDRLRYDTLGDLDKNLVIGQDQNELRAQNQSNWDKFGNGLIHFGSELTLGSAKAITDIPDNLRAIVDGTSIVEEDFTNDLSKWLGSIQDNIREATPIYTPKDAQNSFTPSSMSWWMNNMESMASAATFILPTLAVAKGVGMGVKGLNTLKNALVSTKGERVAQGLAGTLYSNLAESMQDAIPLAQQKYQEALKAGLPEVKAREIGAKAGWDVYTNNLVNVALDLPSTFTLLKNFKGSRNLMNQKSLLQKAGEVLGTEVIPEGLQESINYISRAEAERTADMAIGNKENDYSTLTDRIINKYANDADMWTASFFGALGGGVFQGVSALKDRITGDAKKESQYRQLQQERLGEIASLQNNKQLFDEAQNNILFEQAYNSAKTGTMETFIDKLKDIQNYDSKQAEELGIDKSQIQSKIDKALEIENIYNDVVAKYGTSEGSIDFNRTIAQSIYDKKTYLKDLAKINSEIAAKKSELYKNANELENTAVSLESIDIPFLNERIQELARQKAKNISSLNDIMRTPDIKGEATRKRRYETRQPIVDRLNSKIDEKIKTLQQEVKSTKQRVKESNQSLSEHDEALAGINLEKYPQFEELKTLLDNKNQLEQAIEIADSEYKKATTPEGRASMLYQEASKQAAEVKDQEGEIKKQQDFETKKADLVAKSTSGFVEDKKGNKIPVNEVQFTPDNIKEFKPVSEKQVEIESKRDAENTIDKTVDKKNIIEQSEEITPASPEALSNVESNITELPTPYKTASIDTREEGKANNPKNEALNHYHSFTESLSGEDVKDGKFKFKVVKKPESTPLYDSKYPDAIVLQVVNKQGNPISFDGKSVYTYFPTIPTLQRQNEKYYANHPAKLKLFNDRLTKFVDFEKEVKNNYTRDIDTYLNITGFNSGKFTIKKESNPFALVNTDLTNSKDATKAYRNLDLSLSTLDQKISDNSGAEVPVKKGTLWTTYKGKVVILNNRRLTESEVETTFRLIKEYQSGKTSMTVINGEKVNIKNAIQNIIFFGGNPNSTSKHMLYLNNKNELYYGGVKVETDEQLKDILKDKYLNVNNDTLKIQKEQYIELLPGEGGFTARVWSSYNEYLLSDRLPDGRSRDIKSIPFVTNLESYGKPQIIGRYLTYDSKVYSHFSKNNEKVVEQNTISTEINPVKDLILDSNEFIVLNGTKASLVFNSSGEFVSRIDKEDSTRDVIGKDNLDKSDNKALKEISKNTKSAVDNKVTGQDFEDYRASIPASYEITKTTTPPTRVKEQIPDSFTIAKEDESGKSKAKTIAERQAELRKQKENINKPNFERVITPNPYIKENTEEAKKWLEEVFGNSDDLVIVQGLVEGRAFGQFTQSAQILLSNMAEQGTVFHEAYHKAHNLYFSPTQRERLLSEAKKDEEAMKIARKQYPQLDEDRVAEEVVAEKFRDYMLTGQDSTKLGLFERLMRFIKNLLTGTKSTEEIFEKIANGFYKNTLAYDYDIPAKLYRAIDINNIKLSEAATKDVLDSITYFMFNNLFEGNLTYANLFNRKNTVAIAYDRTLEDFKNEKNNLIDLSQLEDITEQELDEITAKIDSVDFIIKNWSALLPYHYDYFKQFGITLKADETSDLNKDNDDYGRKIEETPEEERIKDTVFDKANYEFSSIDTLPKNVKLLIATLKDGGYNSLGVPKLVDFHKAYAYLAGQLSELSFTEMVEKLQTIDKPYIVDLLDKLKANRTDLTEDDEKLQIQFENELAKPKLKFYLGYVGEDGSFVFGDANHNRTSDKIKEKWKAIIRDSKHIKNINGKLVITSLPKKNNIYEWLEDLGIKLSFKGKLSDKDLQLFNDSTAYIKKALEQQVNSGEVEDVFSLKDVGGRLNTLVELEAKYSEEYAENQHLNSEGKSVFDISLPSFLSKAVAKIKNGKWNEIEYIDTVYNKRSIWIDRIKKGFTNVELSLIDGISDTVNGEGTHTSKLSTSDKLAQEFNSLLGPQNITPMLRMADKKSEYTIKGFGLAIPISQFNNSLNKIDKIGDIFYNYFLDELERIQDYNYSNGYKNIETYSKNGGKWTLFDGILSESVKSDLTEYTKYNKEEIPSDLASRVKEDIISFLERQSSEEYNYIEKNGLLKISDNNFIGIDKELQDKYAPNRTEGEIKNLVKAYTVNKIINHIEQIKLFFGDLAFYKYEKGDFFKRTPFISAAKKQAVNSEYFNNKFLSRTDKFGIGDRLDKKNTERPDLIGKVQTITFDDVEFVSNYYEEYLDAVKSDLKAKGYPSKDIQAMSEKLLKAYTAVNETDAQGYITLDEYREFLNRTGDWTDKHENLYRKIRTGEKITKDDLFYFMPLKAQYSAIHKDGNLAKPIFHKYSLMPLIPSMIKGTNLEKLSKYMTDNKVGYSIYKSASKIAPKVKSNGQYNKLYNNEGEYLADTNFVMEEISYDNLGIQVEIAPKTKNKVVEGTQQRKLKWSDIFESGEADSKLKEMYERYSQIYDEIFEIEKKKLVEELGLDKVDGKYEQADITQLVNTLREEGISRNVPDNLIDGLQVIEKNGKIVLKYPFDALPNRNKIENIIMSIASSRVINLKQNGEGYIQGSISGFEKLGTRDWRVNNRLKFYRKGEDGRTLPAQLAIPLPVELLPLLNRYFPSLSEDEKIEKLNQDIEADLIDKSLLQLIGYRIPTQGLNSIESFEVGFFLPRTSGTLCLVPSEMTAKAGSDFDIDKMNVFRPSVKGIEIDEEGNISSSEAIKKKKTVVLEAEGKEGLQNELMRITKDIIEHPRNFVKLITPNNTNILTSTVEMLRSLTPKENNKSATDTIIPRKVIETAKAFLDGKEGVGISAVHNTHHVLSQIANLIIESDLAFKNNGSLAKSLDVEGENNISDVLSEVINAFVDVAKDPFIRDLNLSTDTANIYLTLVRFGVPFERVALFMNQPIIREYLSARDYNNSNIVSKTGYYHKKTNPTGTKLSGKNLIESIKKNYPSNQKLSEGHYSRIINNNDLLRKLIKKEEFSNEDYNTIQKRILDNFIEYNEVANKLRDVMSVSNQDTKVPKDLATLNDNAVKFEEVSNRKDIKNFDNLFKIGDKSNFIGVFKKAQDEIKDIASPLFITQTTAINEIVQSIVNKLNIPSTGDRQKMLKTIENDFLHFIIQNRATFNGLPFKAYKDKLFNGDNSLPRKILRIKEGTYNKLAPEVQKQISENLFFKELYPIISVEENGTDIVKLFNRRMNSYDSNILTNSFNELYELHPNLADAIVVMGIMQSGIAPSAIAYTDKLPFQVYSKFINPVIEELQFNQGLAKDLDFNYFEYLFYANNMKNKYVKSLVSKINKSLIRDEKIKELGNWKFKNYDTENAIDLSTIEFTEETEQNLSDEELLQVSSSSSKSISELNDKMIGFLNSIGVDYKTLDEIKDRNGNPLNAIAKADLLNKVVEVVEGKMKVDTLPEEAAHFFIEMLPEDSALLSRMIDKIVDYPEFREVVEEYNELYQDDEIRLRKEAIGKVIAKYIVGAYQTTERRKQQQTRNWWNAIWDYIKSIFKPTEQTNDFKEAANKILNGEVEGEFESKEGEMFQLEFEKHDPLLDKIKETLTRQIKVYEKRVESEGETKALDKLKDLRDNLDKLNTIDAVNAFIDKSYSSMQEMGKRIDSIKAYVKDKNFNDKAKRDEMIKELNEIKEYNDSLSILQDINKELSLEALTSGYNNVSEDLKKLASAVSINKLISDIYFDVAIPMIADYLYDFYSKGINEQLEKAGKKGMTREDLEEELKQSKKDISKLESWFTATSNLDDAILGLFSKSVKKQLYKAEAKNNENKEKLVDAFDKWIKTVNRDRNNFAELYKPFIEEVQVSDKSTRLKFIDQDKAKETLSKDDLDFYNTIVDIHLDEQKGIPNDNKLGLFLPALAKDSKEYFKQDGKVKLVDKDKNDEIRYSLQTLEGKNLKKVPIFFSQYMDPSEQSRDIIKSVLSYTSETNKYKAYNEIQGHVNALQNIVNRKNPLLTDNKGNNIVDSLADSIGVSSFLKKEDNVRADKLNTFIDMVFYGIEKKKETVNILGKEINYGRIGDKLTGFTAMNALAGDLLQAFNNTVVGNLTAFAESVGGRNFSKDDWWKANKEYFKKTTTKDGRKFLDKLTKEFDAIQGQFRDSRGMNISGSNLYNALETDSLFILQNATEHQIQVSTMMAFLKATKVKDNKGNESSLYDAYELDENGKLKLKDGFKLSEEDKFELMNKIHSANKRNNGVYNKFDALPMQQYTLGRMALTFRKFIATTTRARFGGMSVDYESGLVNQGFYQSFAKQLAKAYKSKSLSVMFDWENMTDFEKEGVKRSMVDLITLVTTFALVLVLTKGEDDDEEKTALDNFLLYQAMRLHGDISFYMPGIGFNDQFRVLRTPTAVAGTVDKATKLLSQIFKYDFKDNELGLFETYDKDSGINKKGDSKVLSRLGKLIPVYNNIVESLSPENAISILEKTKQ